MSDRDTAIGRSAAIEQMLAQLGAEGSGLGQKSISLQHLFTDEINRKFKFICFVRNKAAHEVIFEFDRMDRFVRDCDEVQAVLNELIASGTNPIIIQNKSQPQTDYSHNSDFSIPPDLVKFEELTFSSVTGRLIQTQARSQMIKVGDSLVTTRNQNIWLRLANGQEEYLELINCVVEPLRKGHLVTVIFASNSNQTRCLAIHIDELEKYFYCTSNIGLIRFKWYFILIIFCLYFAWLPTVGMILCMIIYYGTKFLLGEGIAITIGSLCSFIILPFWLIFKWEQNRKSQIRNHVDRIFGHPYVEYKISFSLKGVLDKISDIVKHI